MYPGERNIWGSALQDTNGSIKGCDGPVVGGVQTPTRVKEFVMLKILVGKNKRI